MSSRQGGTGQNDILRGDILREGVIIRGVGGLYEVRPDALTGSGDAPETLLCGARGIFRREGITPLAGDRVTVRIGELNAPRLPRSERADKTDKSADENVVIEAIAERRNTFIRPPLANLHTLFIVLAAAEPVTEPLTADKLIAIAEDRNVVPVIVITKADVDPQAARGLEELYLKAGFEVFTASGHTGEGVERLRERVLSTPLRDAENKNGVETSNGGDKIGVGSDKINSGYVTGDIITAFAGASGAGKSTLLNALFPVRLKLATAAVSRKIERGRHTTRSVMLYCAGELTDGASDRLYLADTPGFSMLDFTEFDFFPLENLPLDFREFAPYLGKCRYTKCTHLREEGCAVIDAVTRGDIPKSRHDSYVRIYADIKAKPEWERRRERDKNAR